MYYSITKVMQFLLEKFPDLKKVHFYFEPKNITTHQFGTNISPIAMVIELEKNLSLRHEKIIELFEEQPCISFKPNTTSKKIDMDQRMQVLTIKGKVLKFNEYEYYNSSLTTPKNEQLIEKLLSFKIIPTIENVNDPEINIEDFFD
jgi:hypothetical protein